MQKIFDSITHGVELRFEKLNCLTYTRFIKVGPVCSALGPTFNVGPTFNSGFGGTGAHPLMGPSFNSDLLLTRPTLKKRSVSPPFRVVGGGPFVLRPELCDEKLTTGKTGSILCLRSGYKINRFLAIQTLPVFPVVIFSAPA